MNSNIYNDSELEDDKNLIFERDVEDPCVSANITRTNTNTAVYPVVSGGNNTNVGSSVNDHVAYITSPSSPLSLSRHQSYNSLYTTNTNGPGGVVQPADAVVNDAAANNSSIHHTLENLIPPALDASCSIITDENTDLNDVDMIYSQRPSTIGLDMALGNYNNSSCNSGCSSPVLFRSYSHTTSFPTQNINDYINTSPPSARSPSLGLTRSYSQSYQKNCHNSNSNNNNSNANRVLRFYSYADMLSDELNSNPVKNNLSRTTSNIQPNSINTASFHNPFNQNQNQNNLENIEHKTITNKSPRQSASNFHISLSESEACSTDDETEDTKDSPINNGVTTNNQRNVVSLLQHPKPKIPGPSSIDSHLLRSRSNSNSHAFSANRNLLNNNNNNNSTIPVGHHNSFAGQANPPLNIRNRAYSHTTISPPNTPLSSPALALYKTNTNSTSNYLRRSRTPSHYFSLNEDTITPLQTESIGSVLRKKISRTVDSIDNTMD